MLAFTKGPTNQSILRRVSKVLNPFTVSAQVISALAFRISGMWKKNNWSEFCWKNYIRGENEIYF